MGIRGAGGDAHAVFPERSASSGDPNAWGLQNMHTAWRSGCTTGTGCIRPEAQTDPVGPASGIGARGARRRAGLQGIEDGWREASAGGDARTTRDRRIARRWRRVSSAEDDIGFRVVQAEMPKTTPLPAEKPLVQTAVKQTVPDWKVGGPDAAQAVLSHAADVPEPGEPRYARGGLEDRIEAGAGHRYHNSAVAVCATAT